MTGAGGGAGMASRQKEAAHMAASLALSQITNDDLVSPQGKASSNAPASMSALCEPGLTQ
jgi:hypothetical protein